jgi:hypothetical protein
MQHTQEGGGPATCRLTAKGWKLVLTALTVLSLCPVCLTHSPSHYQALGPLAPKPSTHKLIGMLGAIICAASIIFVGYMSVGVAGE